MEPQKKGSFSVSYMSFLLFFFFLLMVCRGMCASVGLGTGEKKSQPLDLSRCSNKNPLSRAAFCVQSANRRTEIISHNSLLQKNRKRWKALMTVKGFMRERKIERGRTVPEKKRERDPNWILCLFALLPACSGHSLAV